MLTLAETARRDALDAVSHDHLVRWRADMKAKCIALIQAEFNRSPFAQIGNLDIKTIDGLLDDGLSDATYDILVEVAA